MKKATAKQLRGQLEEERERTLELLDDLTDERRQDDWTGTLGQPGDIADAATTRSTQGDVDSLIGTTRQRLRHIEAALDRIEEGTYGVCEVCGGPIGDARLEALPFTTLCIDDVGSESSLPA
jgi:DnaK suppressor protein